MICAVIIAAITGYAAHRTPPAAAWRGLRLAAVVLFVGAVATIEGRVLGW